MLDDGDELLHIETNMYVNITLYTACHMHA